jgi:hypothetical protein
VITPLIAAGLVVKLTVKAVELVLNKDKKSTHKSPFKKSNLFAFNDMLRGKKTNRIVCVLLPKR